MDPRLPSSIADCEGLPRSQWIMKYLLLKDNNGDTVAIGDCYSMCPDLVLGSDGPLDLNRVAIQIIDILVVEDRTFD